MSLNSVSKPRITVVTPSYNQGEYLSRTLDSLLSQGYPDLELIVMDGGSTDDSVNIIRKYSKHLASWVSEPDRGQSHAINKGFAASTGQLLTWLNSDDRFLPGALETFARLFAENPSAGLIAGRGVIVDSQEIVLHDTTPAAEITLESVSNWMSGGNFMQPSAMFTREAWQRVGPLDETLNIALDVDYWLRIAKTGMPMLGVSQLLSSALSHPRAKTTALIDQMRLETARVIASHGSTAGYDKALRVYADELKFEKFKLAWFERNYRAFTRNPIVRALHPLVKRFAKEGGYWQKDIPPWSEGV